MKSESGERYILQAEKEAESRAATQASQSWLRWLLRRGPELSSREKQDARDSVFFGKGLNDGVAGWLYGSFAVTGTAWLYAASNYIQQAQQARAGNSDPVTHAVTGFVLGLTGVAAMLSNSFLLKILEARFEEHIQRPLSKALAAPLAVDKMAWTAILFGNLVAMNPVFLFRDRTTLLPLVGEKFRISYYMGFIRDAAAFCKRSISESASPWGKDLTEAALGIRFRRYLIGDGLRRGFDPAQARHLLCKPAYSSHYWSAVSASVEGDLLPAAQPPVHFTSIRDRFAVRRMQSDEEWSDRLISEASLPGDGGLLRPQ